MATNDDLLSTILEMKREIKNDIGDLNNKIETQNQNW